MQCLTKKLKKRETAVINFSMVKANLKGRDVKDSAINVCMVNHRFF